MPMPELSKALKRSPDNRDLDFFYINKISFGQICIPYNPLETLIYLYSLGMLKCSEHAFSFCDDPNLKEHEWLETYMIDKRIESIKSGSLDAL